MGGAYDLYGRQEMCILGFGGEILGDETTCKT